MDFEIDLDSECVWLDDAWLNRDDLVRTIRTMMDAGNFEIARPSHALEALTKSLANARLLALRISPDMSEALNAAALQTGRPVGAVARDAIAAWLASAPSVPQHEAAAPVVPSAASVSAAPPSTPSPGGGSTNATEPASEAEAHPVALTPKRRDSSGSPEDMEKRWFGK